MKKWMTKRLYLRKITNEDRDAVAEFLTDPEVMYAWEHGFSQEEVDNWMAENARREEKNGFSYFAVIRKEDEAFIGVCGILEEKADGKPCMGIGYIFNKKFWHQGYALESAQCCMKYAFEELKLKELTAQIRPENKSSVSVAEAMGMSVTGEFVKHYRGKDMVHKLYHIYNVSESNAKAFQEA